MSDERWTVMRLIDWTKDYFAGAGLENPRLEAEVLLCHVLGMTRVEIYTKYATIPGAGPLARFKALIKRRIAREPTQYLTNKAEFYSIPLYVDSRVLIPRPDSERLVDVALETAGPQQEIKIADLCTGSGCIALALARSLPKARIIAVDIRDHKLEFSYKYGATDTVNSREVNPVEAIREITGDGVDLAIDAFGSAETMTSAFDSVRRGGTAVLVGLAPVGEKVPLDMVDMVRAQKTVAGCYYGSSSPHEAFKKIVGLYLQGKLDIEGLILRSFSLERINEGFDALARGEDGRGIVDFRL